MYYQPHKYLPMRLLVLVMSSSPSSVDCSWPSKFSIFSFLFFLFFFWKRAITSKDYWGRGRMKLEPGIMSRKKSSLLDQTHGFVSCMLIMWTYVYGCLRFVWWTNMTILLWVAIYKYKNNTFYFVLNFCKVIYWMTKKTKVEKAKKI